MTAAFTVAATLGIALAPTAAAGRSCDLLKRAEVERAIGRDVRIGAPPTGVGGACSFSVRGAATDLVNVWELEGDDAETGFEVGEELGGDDVERLPRLGDEAIYLGDPLNTAYVLDEDRLIYLQYFVFSGDDSDKDVRRAVITLTKKALARAGD